MKRTFTTKQKRELARIKRIDRRHSKNELRQNCGTLGFSAAQFATVNTLIAATGRVRIGRSRMAVLCRNAWTKRNSLDFK